MKVFRLFFISLLISFLLANVSLGNEIVVRMATGKEGTNIHSSMVGIASVVNKVLESKGIRLVPTPTAGSTASIRMLNRGEIDFAYASTGDIVDAYNNTGAFSSGDPLKVLPLQGPFYANINIMVVVKPDSPIQNYQDLVGKKLYPFDAASSVFQLFRVMLSEVGIWEGIEIRQVDAMDVADALTMKTVDAVGIHASSDGLAAVGWVKNLDAASDFRIVFPSDEEREKIEKLPNLTFTNIDNKWISEKNRKFNPEEIWAPTLHYAFFPSPELSEEVVYEICKALFENSAEFVNINAMMKAFHHENDPLYWTRKGILEATDIPVHPGFAKYLQEVGAWLPGLKTK